MTTSPPDSKNQIHTALLSAAQTLSPELKAAITSNGPITLEAKQDSPFAQRLCRAVTGQQLSVKATASIWGRVLDSVPAEKTLMVHLLDASSEELRGCGLSRAKVKTVGAIAQAASQGQLEVAKLSMLSASERTAQLTKIWGIGQWTADMMNIFYFGEADIWPEGDVAARKTLERLTSKRRKTVRSAARFAPYRSYLALHMWRYVDATPDATPDQSPYA